MSVLEFVNSTSNQTNITDFNDIFNFIKLMLNGSELYKHQYADLLEPPKYSVATSHRMIWFFTIATYIIALPVLWRMVRAKFYLNIIEYFSAHIVFCAFIAWIPALILLIHHASYKFALTFCRLHYILLSTNFTVPFFFVLYMVTERLFHVYPSFKSKFPRFSKMSTVYIVSACIWLSVMLIYAIASPFDRRDYDSELGKLLINYCSYDYTKLKIISFLRSILYVILFIPIVIAVILIVRHFFMLRGTNQVQPIEKLLTIRVALLASDLVFYEISIFYLETIAESYRSFILATTLSSTFYFTQIVIIALTDEYWLQMFCERSVCLCCCCLFPRRKRTIPVSMPAEVEFSNAPFSHPTAYYSMVDETFNDEFDQATDGPQPTLRIVV